MRMVMNKGMPSHGSEFSFTISAYSWKQRVAAWIADGVQRL